MNSPFKLVPRELFDLPTLVQIFQAYEILEDPPLFRVAFLLVSFAFLRAPNLAPHSVHKFSKSDHLFRQDIIYTPPGAGGGGGGGGGHVLVEWSKT